MEELAFLSQNVFVLHFGQTSHNPRLWEKADEEGCKNCRRLVVELSGMSNRLENWMCIPSCYLQRVLGSGLLMMLVSSLVEPTFP